MEIKVKRLTKYFLGFSEIMKYDTTYNYFVDCENRNERII